MRIAIVGSRDYPDSQQIVDYVNSLEATDVVVSGGAKGVDSIAESAARARGMKVVIFPAEWSKYGRSAGMRRNKDIVDNADKVVAFWHNKSRGTANSIERARAGKKELVIFEK